MNFPSLLNHWKIQSQRVELFGVSASIAGQMIGFAVAEFWQEGEQCNFALLSSKVLPAYRHQPIERQLQQHLQQTVNHSLSKVSE